MGKMSDLAIEAELDIQEQQELMNELISTHGETVEIVEKILAAFPELVQSSILELSLLDNIPIKEAEIKAYENVLDKICGIIQPNNDKAFITVYRHFSFISPNTFGVLYQRWKNNT